MFDALGFELSKRDRRRIMLAPPAYGVALGNARRAALFTGVKKKASVPTWDPTLYGTVVSRWDASNASTLFQGLTPTGALAVNDGDPVGTINDLIASTNPLSAAANGNRPILKLAQQNGLNVVQFDGSVAYLTVILAASVGQPFAILLVYKSIVIGAPGTNDCITQFGSVGTRLMSSNTTPATTINEGITLSYAGNICNGAFGQITLIFNGVSSAIVENGTTRASGNVGVNSAFQISVGGNSLGSRLANIQLGEYVLYSSLTNQSGAQAAMKARWGTP